MSDQSIYFDATKQQQAKLHTAFHFNEKETPSQQQWSQDTYKYFRDCNHSYLYLLWEYREAGFPKAGRANKIIVREAKEFRTSHSVGLDEVPLEYIYQLLEAQFGLDAKVAEDETFPYVR